MSFNTKQLGLLPYSEGLAEQEIAHQHVADGGDDILLLCEHTHVYTFGKSAKKDNLLINSTYLTSIDAEVYETDRGGDITYHGPGQLVGYPIINLRKHNIGVKKYVEILESSIINALLSFGITAYQIDKLTGIWVGKEGETKRKIGAIGIRIKNGVSMHGFALNITTDLDYFTHIVPCGIADKAVTSMQKEIGSVKAEEYISQFIDCFNKEWQKALALQTK